MDERLAVLGLAILAALAWVVPPALRAASYALRPAGVVIYAAGDSDRLFWPPRRFFQGGEELDGKVLGEGGVAAEPVDGWTGLLLGNPLDLNRATQADLEALPGVGPKTAAAIREERALRGGFRSATDLLAVSGVGPVTLERLRPLVRAGVSGPRDLPTRAGREPLE